MSPPRKWTSRLPWFEGNYQDYEADRHKRLDTGPDQPHRIRYKPPALRLRTASPVMPFAICPGFMCLATAPHRLRRPVFAS